MPLCPDVMAPAPHGPVGTAQNGKAEIPYAGFDRRNRIRRPAPVP